jgi:DNA-binding beta-propeller fold protein YncE
MCIKPLLLAVALVSTGCATHGGPPPSPSWPASPKQPIVEYSRSIHGTPSLKRTFFGRMKDFLFGKSPDQYLAKPYGVSSNGRSLLYLADTGKKGVVILDLSAGTGKFIRSAGAQDELLEPVNVIPDKAGNIYVADTRLGKIAVYDPEGVFSHFIGGEEITSPVGMVIDEERRQIFVVDSQQHEVHIFTLDGDHIGRFGGRGDERGQFYHPLGIAINQGDTIYVTDALHFAVQAFDLQGNYLFSFGPRPRGVGTMARPRDVAVDSDGHVYVTDALKHEVQVYDAHGKHLFSIGGRGTGAGQFQLPAGICITESGRIFVADSINRRIQEFVYLGRG